MLMYFSTFIILLYSFYYLALQLLLSCFTTFIILLHNFYYLASQLLLLCFSTFFSCLCATLKRPRLIHKTEEPKWYSVVLSYLCAISCVYGVGVISCLWIVVCRANLEFACAVNNVIGVLVSLVHNVVFP